MARAELPTRATCIPFRAVFLPNCGFTFLILPSNSVGSILGARSCCFSARKQQPKVRPTFSKSWKKTKIRQTAVFRAFLPLFFWPWQHTPCVCFMGHPSVTVLTDPRIEFYICFCFFFLAGLPEWKDPLCFLVVFSLSILVAGKPVAEIYFFSNSCRFDIVVVRYCSVKSISPISMHWHFFFNQHIFVILLFIYFWLDNRSWARRVAPSCANLPNDVLIVLLFCHAPGILSVPWRDVIPTWKSTGQKILCVYFWVRFFSFNFLYFSLRAVILSLSFIRGASYFIHTHHHFFV